MTMLYTVSVDAVEGPTFRGRVHLTNPTVTEIPREAEFPLSLLVDAWWNLDNGFQCDDDDEDRGGYRCSLTPEQGMDLTSRLRRKEEFQTLFELVLGRMVRVTEDGYLLADDNVTVLEPRRKAKDLYELDGGTGRDSYSHFVMTLGDADAFSRRAEDIVTSYTVSRYRNVPLRSEVAAHRRPDGPAWEGKDGPADLDDDDVWDLLVDRPFPGLPYAEITVTVSDPDYLEHLTAGMRWGTTMTGYVG